MDVGTVVTTTTVEPSVVKRVTPPALLGPLARTLLLLLLGPCVMIFMPVATEVNNALAVWLIDLQGRAIDVVKSSEALTSFLLDLHGRAIGAVDLR